MNEINVLELITESVRNILIAERIFPPATGPRKHQFVLDRMRPWVNAQDLQGGPGFGDISELLETVVQLVSLVVKLLNLFGVFRRSPRREDERNHIEPEA